LFDPPEVTRPDTEPAPETNASPFDSLFDHPTTPAAVIAPPAYAEPADQGPLDDGTGNVWQLDEVPQAAPEPTDAVPTVVQLATAVPTATAESAAVTSEPSPDQPPHRRSLADDELLQSLRDGGDVGDGSRSVIEQLQSQLELRAREAREYAVWEQSMLALGTPAAAAALDRARAEFAGVIGSAPVLSSVAQPEAEPFAEGASFEATTVPVAPETRAFESTTSVTPGTAATSEPFGFADPIAPTEPPSSAEASPAAEPSLEGTAFADLLASAAEGDLTVPSADLVAAPFPGFAALPEPLISNEPELAAEPVLPPEPLLPPEPVLSEEPAEPVRPEPLTELEQPFASVPTVEAPGMGELADLPEVAPVEPAPVEPAPVESASFEPASFEPAPLTPSEPTFAAFAPPTDESFTGFAAPSDPQHLTFPPPADLAPFEPAPPVEPETQFEVPATVDPALPVQEGWESPVFLEPPSLIEPAPVVEPTPFAWAAASDEPTQNPAEPTQLAAEPTQNPAEPAQLPAEPAPDEQSARESPDPSAVLPPAAPGMFDNLVTGSAETPRTEAPSTWFTPQPPPLVEPDLPVVPNPPVEPSPPVESDPSPDPEIDPSSGGKRPFGEGVERDNAVDPTDSIFATGLGPVSVNAAGVAVESEGIPLTAPPALIQREEPEITPVLVKQRIFAPELSGQEPTPADERIGRAARMFWLWFAANSSTVAVVFGAIIFSLGMSLREALVATFAGIVVSFLPLGLGTLAGKRSGQPTMVVSRATFGVVGNILPAAIALLSRLFWAAALLWILGAGGASILMGARLVGNFTLAQVTLTLMAIGFILAVVIAYFGYALIAKIQLVISIVSAILIVGFIALTVKDVNMQTALATGDRSWTLALTGAVLVFSFVGVAWSNSSSDLARYQRAGSSGGASMLWATFGTGVPTFILIAYGAILDASNPRIAAGVALDPLDSLGRLLPVWYPVPLLAATVLSLLSGAVLAMYSGGFALQSIGLRVKRSYSTLIVGALVLVIALILATSITDYTQLIRDFATTVAIPVAAWAGMFAAEIMIRNRRFDSVSLLKRGGVYADVRWSNLIALVAITAVGLGFASATIPWLSWEGYLFSAIGVPATSNLAASDIGVFIALLLGLIFPIVAGIPAIRRQERAERPLASFAGHE
jgi:purine-cytosine permease-like protein